jgi:hypothetical protein
VNDATGIRVYSADEAVALLPNDRKIDVLHVIDRGFVGETVSRLDVVAKLRTAVVISDAGELANAFGYGLMLKDYMGRRHYIGVRLDDAGDDA